MCSQIAFGMDQSKTLTNNSPGPKYLLMKRRESEESLKNVSPFLLRKVIDTVCGEIEICKKLFNGEILLKTKNLVQASKLIKLKSLSPSIKIDVTEHKSLNFTKGVMYTNSLRGVSEEEILLELKSQNVTEVKKILKKVGIELKETGLIILTFATINLPEFLHVGYEIMNLREYIPLPMKCKNCQRYGHTAKFCKNDKICCDCGALTHTTESNPTCQNNVLCINCKEENREDTKHSANNRKCPVFLKFKEIQAIKTLQKVGQKKANQLYNERHPNNSTFSTVTRNITQFSSTEDLYKLETPTTSNFNKTNHTATNSTPQHKLKNTKPITKTTTILPRNTSKRTLSLLKTNANKKANLHAAKKSSTDEDDDPLMDES